MRALLVEAVLLGVIAAAFILVRRTQRRNRTLEDENADLGEKVDVWVEAEREKQPSITCPVCAMTSYNPNDIREGYCGNCHAFTGRPRRS